MKRKLFGLLSALLILATVCSCGTETKESLLEKATEIDATDIAADVTNVAKAKAYEGNTYLLDGHVYEITEDYCAIIPLCEKWNSASETYEELYDLEEYESGHKHEVGTHEYWYGYKMWTETVYDFYQMWFQIRVYLSTEELAQLEKCDGVQVVGTIDETGLEEPANANAADITYLSMHTAYLVDITDY